MHLSAAASPNPRLAPLVDGAVRDPAIEIAWTIDHPGRLFRDHLTADRYDLFELSLSAYFEVRASRKLSHLRWTALPVFPSKALLPLELCVRRDSPLQSWADLHGHTVGVPDVHMTAAVWFRLMLGELHGIGTPDVAWVNGRRPEHRHSTVVGIEGLAGAPVRELPAGMTLQGALESGFVDAAFGDQAGAAVKANEAVRRLLDPASGAEALVRFARRTGVTPVNHVMVLQDRLIADRDFAVRLIDLFDRSKAVARKAPGTLSPAEAIFQREDVFGEDAYPSGLEANRRMLELLRDALGSEGRLASRPPLEELFVNGTLR